jgi:hypothetical protein
MYYVITFAGSVFLLYQDAKRHQLNGTAYSLDVNLLQSYHTTEELFFLCFICLIPYYLVSCKQLLSVAESNS